MIDEPPMLGRGVGRAEAGEVHADKQVHPFTYPARIRRIERGREQLEIAFLEHHAAVRCSGRISGNVVDRNGGDGEAQRFPYRSRGTEVRHKVRKMIEIELARGRALSRSS